MLSADKQRAILRMLRTEIATALAAVTDCNKDVLEAFEVGKTSYDPDQGTFTVKINGMFKGGQKPEERAYIELAKLLALPTHGFDRDVPVTEPGIKLPPLFSYVRTNGKADSAVRIVGARPRAKFNVIAARKDGKRTCYRAEDIARLAKAQGLVT